MNNNVKVLLVDDHAVVRAGFKQFLATGRNIEVVAEADRGEQAVQLYQSLTIDIVVMDLSMPGIGGLETIRRILQRHGDARVLVFSVHHEQVYINRALEAGAKGYITKNSAPEILSAAIECIMQGQIYIENELLADIMDETAPGNHYQNVIKTFTAREFDIFRLLSQGLTVHKISEELCLGYKTVANYATRIKKKMQVSSVAELAHVAVILGVIER